MNPLYKHLLLSVFIAGILFALFGVALDYREGQPIDIGKFIFRTLVFGIGMGLINWWTSEYARKQAEKKRLQ